MKRIFIAALLFASCTKQASKPQTVNDNCGIILSIENENVTGTGNIFKIQNTLFIRWNDGTKSEVQLINSNYRVGEDYCK